MRLHHYPGLFGDPRSRGLRVAVGVSLLVHVVLLLTVGRIHTRLPDRTFFSPVHFVDLVEGPPAVAKSPAAPPTPPPPAEKPATVRPATPPPTPAKPSVPKPKPKPTIDREAVERLLARTQEPPPATQPAEPLAEERISEHIARLREKHQTPTPTQKASEDAVGDSSVEDAIASIRQKISTPTSRPQAGATARVGVRGGGSNVLQQVRLRAYYNQLWEHVTRHWAIPPSLQGRSYTVIVSIVLDRRGNLVRSWVEEPSGSDGFDQSALRALQRSQPLPAFPDVIEADTLEVGFRFHPD